MRVRHHFEFSAAHRLEQHGGSCSSLHGHNYTLIVEVAGEVDPSTGMLIDFHELERLVREHALQTLDHSYLNDLMTIPTAEHIVQWVWQHLAPVVHGLYELTLYELSNAAVVYRGEHER